MLDLPTVQGVLIIHRKPAKRQNKAFAELEDLSSYAACARGPQNHEK